MVQFVEGHPRLAFTKVINLNHSSLGLEQIMISTYTAVSWLPGMEPGPGKRILLEETRGAHFIKMV